MLSDELSCRLATPADAADLASFGAEAFVAAFGHTLAPGDLARHVARTYSEARQYQELTDPAAWTLIAERSGGSDPGLVAPPASELVGAAYLRVRRPPVDPAPEQDWVEIARFYVARPHWRTGVSSELMVATLRSIREGGIPLVWLQTWERADPARRFYRKWGFLEIGETEFLAGRERQRDVVLARRVRSYELRAKS